MEAVSLCIDFRTIHKALESRVSVEFVADEEDAVAIDELLLIASPPVDRVLSRLQQRGFLDSGQGSALMVAIGLLCLRYTQHREGAEIADSLKLAVADVLNHPLIQHHLTQATVTGIDQAAGV